MYIARGGLPYKTDRGMPALSLRGVNFRGLVSLMVFWAKTHLGLHTTK